MGDLLERKTTNRFINVVNREGSILLDETVSPLTELAHQGLAPPLSHVAMTVVSPSFTLKQRTSQKFNQISVLRQTLRGKGSDMKIDIPLTSKP
jgi:hypothetical protein